MAASIGFDVFARDHASKTFTKVGDNAEHTGKRFSKMGGTLKKAAKIGLLGLGTAAVGAAVGLEKMVKAGAEDEAGQARLAKALKNSAGATKGQVAATEAWITKQGTALGVTDDELRPALGRLVASTHDVGKAQKLASLAMDVSAGTGKSLGAVAMALGKAQDGNVSGLARLGIKTKDAAGKTLSLKQVTKELADTFGGQAKTKANTFQGKMDRLKVVFHETEEAIGQKLIPILTKLGTWFLGKGLPAIKRFGAELKSGEGVVGHFATAIAAIGKALMTAASFVAHHRAVLVTLIGAYAAFKAVQLGMAAASAVQLVALKAQTVGTAEQAVVSKLAAGAAKVWAAGQWLLNAALDANPIGLIVIGIAALVAGFIYAYKHSETFRKIVNAAFTAIKVVAGGVLRWLANAVKTVVGFVKKHWRLLVSIIGGPLVAIVLLVIKHWAKIKQATTAVWNAIKRVVTGAWHGIGSVTKKGVGAIVGAVKAVPGKIRDLGAAFKNAGKHIIGALVNGLKNAGGVISGIAGNVWRAVKHLLNAAIGKINSALDFTIHLPGPDIHINTPNIPKLARGGRATKPTLAMIGEGREPESVLPDSVLGGLLNRRGRSSGGNLYLTVNINGPGNNVAAGREVVKAVKDYAQSIGLTTQRAAEAFAR